MKKNIWLRTLALVAAAALAVPALAKPISKTIQLSRKATFGRAELRAGEYRLLVDGSKVLVQKAGNTLAETEGRWEERASKSEYNSLLIGQDGRVKEVRFSGEKRVLVLSE